MSPTVPGSEATWAECLDVFCGQVSTTEARVYVRWRGDDEVHLSGYVEGPECEFAATLTSQASLVDLGPGQGRLAMATIVDPCIWTPLHPSTYQLHLNVDQADHPQTMIRHFAIKHFGVQGRDFRMDSKRWVFRGIHGIDGEPAQLARCRELLAGIVVSVSSSDQWQQHHSALERAGRAGIPVALVLKCEQQSCPDLLRRAAQYPAVIMACIRTELPLDRSIRKVAPNLCLLQPVAGWREMAEFERLSEWADAAWLENPTTDVPANAQQVSWPVLAVRPYGSEGTLAEKRAACDRLQRDLAGQIECAAFIV